MNYEPEHAPFASNNPFKKQSQFHDLVTDISYCIDPICANVYMCLENELSEFFLVFISLFFKGTFSVVVKMCEINGRGKWMLKFRIFFVRNSGNSSVTYKSIIRFDSAPPPPCLCINTALIVVATPGESHEQQIIIFFEFPGNLVCVCYSHVRGFVSRV